jgi:hypothetical protein
MVMSKKTAKKTNTPEGVCTTRAGRPRKYATEAGRLAAVKASKDRSRARQTEAAKAEGIVKRPVGRPKKPIVLDPELEAKKARMAQTLAEMGLTPKPPMTKEEAHEALAELGIDAKKFL